MKVDTPATEILSKFVWPSTSQSPFKSEFPSMTKPSATVLPVTLIPVLVVSNFGLLLKNRRAEPEDCLPSK